MTFRVTTKKERKIPHSMEERGELDVQIVFGRNGRCLFYLFKIYILGGGVATVGGVV